MKSNNMKKVVVIICTLVVLCIIVASCKSGERCAAYGESHKYQKQQNY